MNNYYVYYHYTLDTNELFYIGKGTGRRAFDKHLRNIYWKRKVDKHGFRVEIVQDNISSDEALIVEIKMIEFYKNQGIKLTNITDGGEGSRGYLRSLETKSKLSKAAKGNKNNLGKKFSKEHRLKISCAMKNIPKTAEHKMKIGKAHLGKIYSPETKAKISASQKERWARIKREN